MIPFIITGDTHREYGRMLEIFEVMKKYPEQEKYLCVAGDFGYLLENTFIEHQMLNEFEQQNFTVVVIPGNHENYLEFQKYEVVDFHGAKAHQIRKNIFYICRGEIFKIGNKSFFAMSGGYSTDKYMRRENVSWWKEEMPTDAEYQYAAQNLSDYKKSGGTVNYVISHTAPLSGLSYLGKDHGYEEYPLNNFLEYVRETLKDECEMHFYGHLHMDKQMPSLRQRALWFDYVELMIWEE